MSDFNLEHLANNLSLSQGKEYIKQYFVPLTNGNHAILTSEGKYNIISRDIIKQVYLNRMPKELSHFYEKEYYTVRSISYELGKETFYQNTLNLCPKMKHSYKPFEQFDDSVKTSMNFMLKFIKDIICGGKQDSYNFTMKWLSNMIRGNKNNSCLYLKSSVQGIGKSTLPEFIRDFVIGEDLSLESGSRPLTSCFNSILEGKLMVVFEELENFSFKEWCNISSTLKRIITSSTYLIEGKNINSYTTNNINNYILISNNDAIKDDEGRRYFILDLSTKHKGDHSYFGKLRSECFNNEVGHAFYCYMLEYDINNFNPQAYPDTDSKLDSIAKRLDSVHLFLKTEYILNNKSLKKIPVGEIHEEYKLFCSTIPMKPYHKIDFNKKMAELNLKYTHTPKGNYYDVEHKTLLNIANTGKWIHELDEFIDESINVNENKNLFVLTDEREVSTLKKENEELKKKIASLELMLNQSVEEEDDGIEVQIDDVEIEIEPKTESYNRDYNRDEQMEILFNQLI